jgi:hypothetical protein
LSPFFVTETQLYCDSKQRDFLHSCIPNVQSICRMVESLLRRHEEGEGKAGVWCGSETELSPLRPQQGDVFSYVIGRFCISVLLATGEAGGDVTMRL